MSHGYRAVGWNRQKKIYDLVLAAGVAAFLVVFIGLTLALEPKADPTVVILRALALAAFVLLHLVLSVGPLSRLDPRWLPWLYNRRHMGVTLFLLAFLHGALAMLYYHGFGVVGPLESLFDGGRWNSVAQFPFQPLGAFALAVLFLMAATSHDFWLANLTPPVWKALHMLVYVAYGLVVAHVALGYLQAETGLLPTALTGVGALWICGLHLVAGRRSATLDRQQEYPGDEDGYLDVMAVADIEEKRGRIVTLAGDRVAVFRYDGKVSAISNACQHQNGPLGEGRVIDGFVTCPWHGFQYRPDDGASPPPFTEKVPTFNLKVKDGRVWIHPTPNPPGTRVEPACVGEPP